jgi:hypothetical protein
MAKDIGFDKRDYLMYGNDSEFNNNDDEDDEIVIEEDVDVSMNEELQFQTLKTLEECQHDLLYPPCLKDINFRKLYDQIIYKS